MNLLKIFSLLVPEHRKLVITVQLTSYAIKGYCQGCVRQFYKQKQKMLISPIPSTFII